MEEISCCKKEDTNSGLKTGILYGLIPHSFCILFVLFSTMGAVFATSLLKQLLMIPYIFQLLVLISLVLATISSIIYLKRINSLCFNGIRSKWKYITILYSVTIIVNLFVFFVAMPAVANMKSGDINQANLSTISITVQIPCSGHAPLIIDEIKKEKGVSSVEFKMPNIFEIKYQPEKTSPMDIVSSEIFKTFKATIR